MDQLTFMRSFVDVAKSRSFSEAARTRGISRSLVSRHVAELERAVGVRLVNRTARAVKLTSAGARYASFAERVIGEIDSEQAALRGMRDRLEGPLAIIGPKWIGCREIVDAIIAFSCQYPEIHVRFEVGGLSDSAYDVFDKGFDVALLIRQQARERNLALREIADLDFVLCASPIYLRRTGHPAKVTELDAHDCLVNTDYDVWHLQQAGRDVHLRISEPAYSSNTYVTLRKAALAGRGIAQLPLIHVAGHLADGSLERVLPGSEAPSRKLYALHLPGNQSQARVELFLDFIADWLSEESTALIAPARSA
jgi:DNA-binding transcriptional LysR family regulator